MQISRPDVLHQVPWNFRNGDVEKAGDVVLKERPDRLNYVYQTLGTPLHSGILKGDINFIKWLCWNGADPNIRAQITYKGRNYGNVTPIELGTIVNIDVARIFRTCKTERVDETIGVAKNLPTLVTEKVASFLGGRKSLKRKSRRRRRLTKRRF